MGGSVAEAAAAGAGGCGLAPVDDRSAPSSGGVAGARLHPLGRGSGRVAGCAGGNAWSRRGCSRSTRKGELVWETMVLTMARQLGKSWLLRELLLWRIHQADRFGEPQDVIHTGKDLAVCKEVQRPARVWAKARADTYKVREVNGQEEIELLSDGSRWMLRAKEAVYGYSCQCGAADEAWKVQGVVDRGGVDADDGGAGAAAAVVGVDGAPAGDDADARPPPARAGQLEDGDGDLLVEWSAPRPAPAWMTWTLGGWRRRIGRHGGNG